MDSTDPAAAISLPYPQIIQLFIIVVSTLVIGGHHIIHKNRIHRDQMDIEAIRHYGISSRERDIISLINSGQSNEEIGSRLFISTSTVKNHIYHIYRKTGVHNRVELLNAVMNGDSDL